MQLSSPLGILLILSVTSALVTPWRRLGAQAVDSTGMPSLELLAQEAGRASRRHPIRAVAHALLCEPTHPLVDSASLAACATLDSTRAAAITAAFARGLEVRVIETGNDAVPDLSVCPEDIDKAVGPRVLLARVTPPLVGMREGKWEGRITMELRCRSTVGGSGAGVVTMGKEFLYQWSGREWKLYQHAWWRSGR